MKFLVVDGLRKTRLFYKNQIECICSYAEIIPCISAEDAIFNVIDKEPDIIVASEVLSFRNSFELARILKKMGRRIPLIVISTDDTNALQAIKNDVFAYLLMPILNDVLKDAIEHAIDYINDQLLLKYGTKRNKKKPPIKLTLTNSEYKFIDLEKVVYFAASQSYTEIHYVDGKTDLSCLSLGKIDRMMKDYLFMRISRKTIINLKNIQRIDRKKKVCAVDYMGDLKTFAITPDNLKKLVEASNLI